jgi:pimeloyl-ACP methyl ester carboxylesterase
MRYRSTILLAICAAVPLLSQQPDVGPPPGRLFDVGGRRLHLHCTGAGTPTVVIESGASAFAIDWTLVQPEIARTNRVCSYDRAGHGWSDPVTDAAPRASIPGELHALLQTAQEKPPYILVGASMGALWVRRYQIDYPDEVVGLVLVDPAHEDRLFTYFEGSAVAIAALTPEQVRSSIPSGDIRIPRQRSPQTGAPFDRLPRELYEIRILLDQRLIASQPWVVTYEQRVRGAVGEHENLATLRQIGLTQTHPAGDRPVVVLSRSMGANQEMWDVHARAARISSNSRHTVVAEAGHEIHLFKPDAVIQAIHDVRDACRNKSKLPPR